VLAGVVMLQEKIKREEHPFRKVFHLSGGSEGTTKPILVDGETKSADTRGPGMEGVPIRGSSATPPKFFESRLGLMWTPPAQRITLSAAEQAIIAELKTQFGEHMVAAEFTSDMPAITTTKDKIIEVLQFLKHKAKFRFERLEDYTAVDESARRQRSRFADFTLVYTLLCFEPPMRMRVKVPLYGEFPESFSITGLWPNADWYEREIWDMFGIKFTGHPNLTRLIMPVDWQGHPLRKTHPDRATDMPPYTIEDARMLQPLAGDAFVGKHSGDETLVLNIGPHHTATHGLLRIILALDGETITDLNLDIGYHHRAVEKLGERQTWLQFIPYCDRVDYMAGAANELPYVLAVEQIAGITVPERAQFIRVLMTELFRLANHLAFLGIMGGDVGAMTAPFYTFREREKVMDIVELISGGRLHPAWFRLGGVADDMPEGWKEPIQGLIKMLPGRLKEYENLILNNPVFKARTKGVGRLTRQEAIDWGVTGPNLRACGMNWDLRKKMPYSGYDRFEFEVPTGVDGDCWTRYRLRIEECRQSIHIIDQAIENIPEGRFVTDDYRYVMPVRRDMLHDIESLIHHFIHVTAGPKIPAGEAYFACEIPRGEQGYYIVSDGLGSAYRLHVRGPTFTNIQVLKRMVVGGTIADLVANLGALDYTLPDLDR